MFFQKRFRHNFWGQAVGIVAVTLAAGFSPGTATAGQHCEPAPITSRDIRNGINLAAQTAEQLARQRVQVGIIARVGQDLSQWGQQYSHIGIVYRDRTVGTVPTWRVVHKLNNCGTDNAHLYRQGLVEFFTDAPHDWQTAIVPLAPGTGARVRRVAQSNELLRRMHQPRYSMLAYPWATRYQQSNQWVTETLAMALEPQVKNRAQAQQWLQFKGYTPDRLKIGAFKRLGARITRANVEFDDHPTRLRFSGRIQTTTADSVLHWLQRSRLGTEKIVIRLDPFRRYYSQQQRKHRSPGNRAQDRFRPHTETQTHRRQQQAPSRGTDAENFWQ
jgi:hypothetical protein